VNVLHGEIAADGRTVVLFATGPQVEQIAAALALLTPTISSAGKPDVNPIGALKVPLSWALCVQMAAQFPAVWRPGPRLQAWLFEQVRARIRAPWTDREIEAVRAHMPDDAPEPYDYQWEGAWMLSGTGRGFLFDDPGTGKTLTALLALLWLRALGALPIAGPILVVCPNSVMDSWVRAVHTWTNLRAVAWRGSKPARERLMGTADVYVASYGMARNDGYAERRWAKTKTRPATVTPGGPLYRLGAVAVVVDECHGIKNRSTGQSQTVQKLGVRAMVALMLSGTPITHTVRDLWPALHTIEPAGFPSAERYGERYLTTVPGDYDDVVLGLNKFREPEFRQVLQGQYRRLAKADVLSQLPPKVYSVREVELPAEWRKVYDAMEQDMIAQLPDTGEELSVMSALAQLTRLCQLASSAADVWTELETVEDPLTGLPIAEPVTRVKLRAPSWKADALIEVLDERPSQQVAVFAPSRQLIDVAHELVAKAGYRCVTVVGGQSAAERTEGIDAFQRGDADVILLTTQAGGVGLTLTAASVVVFLQRPWSYVEAAQAEDRCHRIGSEIHESIEIIDIVAKDTVDARVRSVLREKAGALAQLLEDPRIMTEVLGGAK
jgi:SNF2 family DNA or RNA helicase